MGTLSLAAVDALARLALAARRQGRAPRVERATPELRGLIAFCGLEQALGLELQRQSEEREERSGVEEEGELGDAAG